MQCFLFISYGNCVRLRDWQIDWEGQDGPILIGTLEWIRRIGFKHAGQRQYWAPTGGLYQLVSFKWCKPAWLAGFKRLFQHTVQAKPSPLQSVCVCLTASCHLWIAKKKERGIPLMFFFHFACVCCLWYLLFGVNFKQQMMKLWHTRVNKFPNWHSFVNLCDWMCFTPTLWAVQKQQLLQINSAEHHEWMF